MKTLLLLVFVTISVHGIPTSPPAGTADKLEGFPWIKASKVKSRFGTTPTPPVALTDASTNGAAGVASPSLPQPIAQQSQTQPLISDEMLQNYIAALAARLQPQGQPETPIPSPPPKRLGKQKVPKQLKPQDSVNPTTPAYWQVEKTEYPDSLYDEFYLDWLRKRQVETIPVATPNPLELYESAAVEPTPAPQTNNSPAPSSPQTVPPPFPYPSVPLAMNPFANPFLYPFTGLKMTKAMANAQVSAALAAWNITTTAKPVKIKLKIPIPPGGDIAQVVASGIAGFPTGTTYELSKKK